jgi:hypothetical protein
MFTSLEALIVSTSDTFFNLILFANSELTQNKMGIKILRKNFMVIISMRFK